jgi:hypothetical protein
VAVMAKVETIAALERFSAFLLHMTLLVTVVAAMDFRGRTVLGILLDWNDCNGIPVGNELVDVREQANIVTRRHVPLRFVEPNKDPAAHDDHLGLAGSSDGHA